MAENVAFIVALCVLVGLVLIPAYEASTRQRYGWLLAVILLAPLAGALWFLTKQRARG